MGTVAATEALLRFAVAPNDPRALSVTLLTTGTANDVALGDSQMMSFLTGVPEMLNLAYFGENMVITRVKARRYFANRRPERVIIQATPNMFSDERENSARSEWTRDYIESISGDGNALLYSLQPQHRLYIRDYWKTWLSKGKFESRGRIMPDGAYFVNTSVPAEYTEPEFREAVEKRVRYQRPLAEYSRTRNYEAFVGLLDFLDRRGAEVCLVTTPVPRAYREFASQYPEYSLVLSGFGELARHYGFVHLNLWAAVDDNASFTDTDHLTLAAGREWSRIAVDRCFAAREPREAGMKGLVSP